MLKKVKWGIEEENDGWVESRGELQGRTGHYSYLRGCAEKQ